MAKKWIDFVKEVKARYPKGTSLKEILPTASAEWKRIRGTSSSDSSSSVRRSRSRTISKTHKRKRSRSRDRSNNGRRRRSVRRRRRGSRSHFRSPMAGGAVGEDKYLTELSKKHNTKPSFYDASEEEKFLNKQIFPNIKIILSKEPSTYSCKSCEKTTPPYGYKCECNSEKKTVARQTLINKKSELKKLLKDRHDEYKKEDNNRYKETDTDKKTGNTSNSHPKQIRTMEERIKQLEKIIKFIDDLEKGGPEAAPEAEGADEVAAPVAAPGQQVKGKEGEEGEAPAPAPTAGQQGEATALPEALPEAADAAADAAAGGGTKKRRYRKKRGGSANPDLAQQTTGSGNVMSAGNLVSPPAMDPNALAPEMQGGRRKTFKKRRYRRR